MGTYRIKRKTFSNDQQDNHNGLKAAKLGLATATVGGLAAAGYDEYARDIAKKHLGNGDMKKGSEELGKYMSADKKYESFSGYTKDLKSGKGKASTLGKESKRKIEELLKKNKRYKMAAAYGLGAAVTGIGHELYKRNKK